MRIHRIAIRNFRGVVACEVAFPLNGVTIIEGPNEVGKSSLAEAVDLLLDYPHDSRHRDVVAVKPVHRDVGPEVEIELTTGPYHVVYSKRWFRQPETRLSVLAPVAESLVARTAHDRMSAILDATLDRNLYRALRFVQGDRVAQGLVGNSTTLIGALDRAAAGGAGDPEVESSLWQAIQAERLRYFTPNGRASVERERLAARLQQAVLALEASRLQVARIEEAGERYRSVLGELDELKSGEAEAAIELADARTARHEVARMELDIETVKSRARSEDAQASRTSEALTARRELAASADALRRECDRLAERLAAEEPALVVAQEQLEVVRCALVSAEADREAASSDLAVAEGDLVFRRAEVSDLLLSRRLGRITEARAQETEALRFIEACKVTKQTRPLVENGVRRLSELRAAREIASPSVVFEARAAIDVTIDAVPLHLREGDSHNVGVTSDTRISVEDRLVMYVRAGKPAADIQVEIAEAERGLTQLLHRYELDPNDPLTALTNILDGRRDAENNVEAAKRTKCDALEDLTEEQLAAKALNARAVVADYPTTRAVGRALPATFEGAEQIVDAAKRRLRECEAVETRQRNHVTSAQGILHGQKLAARVTSELLRRETDAHLKAQSSLVEAQARTTDEALVVEVGVAAQSAERARLDRDEALVAFAARDPESVRLRFDNADKRTTRVGTERQRLERDGVELETTLRLMGASDIQASVDEAEVKVEQLRRSAEATERKAAAALCLWSTFASHRDSARLAYVAPYKEQIEKLARLVFGPETSIEVDPKDFSLTARNLGGVVVPFDSLSTGAREQLSVVARLACAILVNPDGVEGDAGVPVILDDALGSSDPERLKRLAPAFTAAAKQAQVVVLTSTPGRYRRVGDATVIRLSGAGE